MRKASVQEDRLLAVRYGCAGGAESLSRIHADRRFRESETGRLGGLTAKSAKIL
jgi:hypothetical protein